VNLFDFPPFGFLEAAQRLFDSPVRAAMKCEEFMDGNQLVVRAELPGVDPESGIKVSVSDGVLTIQATREERKEEKDVGSYRSEFSYGEMRRSLVLPQDTRADGITASYKDGVRSKSRFSLVIHSPRAASTACAAIAPDTARAPASSVTLLLPAYALRAYPSVMWARSAQTGGAVSLRSCG
jgi:HSP20 family protein